jgi:hypothetical protein
MRRALPLLIVFLLAAAPAHAQGPDRETPASAEKALDRVEALLDAPKVKDKRALTPALAALARSRSELRSAADRKRAAAILARPTDPGDPEEWTAPPSDRHRSCTAHFCFHWVDSTEDKPVGVIENSDTPSEFVELLATSFEDSYTVEVTELGWDEPLPDADRGGDDRLDVYVADIGDEAYGYAVPEDDARSSSAYLVMDNDYSAAQFPEYGGDPTAPAQVTAAHEFNHVLQYRYDAFQDDWMFEATATWAEEKVYDEVDDYLQYLDPWADLPEQPLTTARHQAQSTLKQYGSAIWNHWLETRFGAESVRLAWALSQNDTVDGGGFAPLAYDRAIRARGGPGFAPELQDFLAATAEWDAADSGVREGPTFPREVDRPESLSLNGPAATGFVDHTASVLLGVPATDASQLHLTGGLPAGVAGSIALVGFDADSNSQTRVVRPLDADGRVTATLDGPARFERITAVVTNSDVSTTRDWIPATRDWIWTRDDQSYSLAATTGAPPVEPTPTPSPTPTPTPTVTPTPTPIPATSVRLSRSTTRIGSVVRTGVLAFFARSNKSGRLAAASSVDRTTARRLRVGRRTTSTGRGRRTLSAPGRFKVNVRLTRKARSALKRHRNRTVRIKVVATFVPADGTRAVRRTLSVLLRP